MSFYGNVTYYLSNAFNKIIYRNAGSASGNNASVDSKASPGIPAYEYGLNPRNRKDETILETGNKWIVFADPGNTVQNNQIKIFHQTVRSTPNDVQAIPTIIPASEENPPTNLAFGSVLSLPTITYDNAGHIVSSGTVAYKLPTPSGESDLNKIRYRLSTLEEQVTGEHDTYQGDGTGEVYEVTSPYSKRIDDVESKVGQWLMRGNGEISNTLEPESIGITLEELMVRIGLRNKSAGNYIVVDETVPNISYTPGSVLAELKLNSVYAYSAQLLSLSCRSKINEIINWVNTPHDAGATANIEPMLNIDPSQQP